MIALLGFALAVLAASFKSKSQLEAENAVLRHQLIILRRTGATPADGPRPLVLCPTISVVPVDPDGSHYHPARDARALASGRLSLLLALDIAHSGGRPQIDTDLRTLIRQMSVENPLWGAPRIHGELLKLGFDVAQSSVAKYMAKRRGSPKARNGAPFCETTRRTLLPWTCLSFRTLASTYSMVENYCDDPQKMIVFDENFGHWL